MPDLVDYNKTIIVDCFNAEIDWDKMVTYKKLCKDDFLLCLSSVKDAHMANKREIEWYWGFPVTSLYDATAFARLGSHYLKLGAPLFFQWDLIKKVFPDMKFRHTPNVAYNDDLPRPDGVSGTWIRPEDIHWYEDYIDVIEFEDCDPDKERTLYQIYMIDHEWNSILELLISNLNYEGTNRMIISELAKKRMNCGQACENGRKCTICHRTLKIANPERV